MVNVSGLSLICRLCGCIFLSVQSSGEVLWSRVCLYPLSGTNTRNSVSRFLAFLALVHMKLIILCNLGGLVCMWGFLSLWYDNVKLGSLSKITYTVWVCVSDQTLLSLCLRSNWVVVLSRYSSDPEFLDSDTLMGQGQNVLVWSSHTVLLVLEPVHVSGTEREALLLSSDPDDSES